MKLKTARTVLYVLGGVILALALLGGILQEQRFLYAVLGAFVLFAVLCVTQWRCPKCGRFMRKLTVKQCPRCGHKLDL